MRRILPTSLVCLSLLLGGASLGSAQPAKSKSPSKTANGPAAGTGQVRVESELSSKSQVAERLGLPPSELGKSITFDASTWRHEDGKGQISMSAYHVSGIENSSEDPRAPAQGIRFLFKQADSGSIDFSFHGALANRAMHVECVLEDLQNIEVGPLGSGVGSSPQPGASVISFEHRGPRASIKLRATGSPTESDMGTWATVLVRECRITPAKK